MAGKSNIKKSREIVERVRGWAAERETAGDTHRFIRSGILNKSLVAETLCFPRSLWRSNEGLKELAARLNQTWGDGRARKGDLIARLDAVIAEADAQGAALPNDGESLLLGAILSLAGLESQHLQRYAEIRRKLSAHAETHGLAFSRTGSVAPEEDAPDGEYDPAEMVSAARLREAQMRLAQAERRNAELKAENVSLRAQIMRGHEIAELIALGGRIKPDIP